MKKEKKMMKFPMKVFCSILFLAVVANAQEGAAVNQTFGPPLYGWQKVLFFDGSNNLTYVCMARSRVAETSMSVSSATNANPVVFTLSAAHGFGEFATTGAVTNPTVKIAGGTGNWTVVNGVWAATITAADKFSIPVNSTSIGALAGTITVTTAAPRTTEPVWAVQRNYYDVSNNLVAVGWANDPSGAGSGTVTFGATVAKFRCSARATLSYQ